MTIVVFASCNNNTNSITKQTVAVLASQQEGLNRNPSHIHYSKHAKCRMGCRHIDETEVKNMIETGTINYQKSDLQKDDCNKRYAVEGYSKSQQHLRIIFVPCANDVTIVTCIDIGEHWKCDCPGD